MNASLSDYREELTTHGTILLSMSWYGKCQKSAIHLND